VGGIRLVPQKIVISGVVDPLVTSKNRSLTVLRGGISVGHFEILLPPTLPSQLAQRNTSTLLWNKFDVPPLAADDDCQHRPPVEPLRSQERGRQNFLKSASLTEFRRETGPGVIASAED